MIKIFILFLLSLSILPVSSKAYEYGMGVGIIMGEPTGITLKNWTDADIALEASAAWSQKKITVHIGLLIHNFNIFSSGTGALPVYYGAGTILNAAEGRESRTGLRGSAGLSYLPNGLPLEVFAEIGPVIYLIPETGFDLTGGMGLRFYF